MILKRGSFSFRLFSISIIVGLVFALTSVLANNYFYRKITIRIIEDRIFHFLKHTEYTIKNSQNLRPEDFKTSIFFSPDEFYKLTFYSESGEVITEVKGTAEFDDNYIPDFRQIISNNYLTRTGKDRYYSFITKLKYNLPDGRDAPGYIVLSLNLGTTLQAAGEINRFRIIFFAVIILLLTIFVYFSTRSLTAPFNKLLEDIRDISKGNLRPIDRNRFEYGEIIEILNNFNSLLGSLNDARKDLNMSEERLKTLLEKSRDVILVLDKNFRIVYASSTFREISGIDINKAESRLYLSDFVSVEDRGKLLP
ncbi:MAG: PAS domain S-box protein, partial [Deltaproteobacteria bacterium]|nr:PAS domain S-box protein [Deltaproteobacteria bacterium]